MEGIDWLNVIAAGTAVFVLVGGMLMMFTNIWTTKDK